MTTQELAALLDTLEQRYGRVEYTEPTDPFELIVYTNCGYPPSQENCRKGFEALKSSVGLSAAALLAASERQLAKILRAGGIVPELRASRLKIVARLVTEDFGDLRRMLSADPKARKALKRFPTIGDPGVDKILSFAPAYRSPRSRRTAITHCCALGLEPTFRTMLRAIGRCGRSSRASSRMRLSP